MIQETIFRESEADRWFERNQAVLRPDKLSGSDPLLKVLADANVRPASVLEVGASNGYRLEALRKLSGCQATAVEPSSAAVADGRARFPRVRFVQGLAHELAGFAAGEFDLILASFVLHWVDRPRLFETAAAFDRVLIDGGRLIIADFLPDYPRQVRYHHLPGLNIWTYKQDYATLWSASTLYHLEQRRVFDYRTRQPSDKAPPEQRFVISLLRKDHGGYVPVESPTSGSFSRS